MNGMKAGVLAMPSVKNNRQPQILEGTSKVATLQEMTEKLRVANPENKPMNLRHIATILWPGAEWLDVKAHHHNGGARRGAKVAAGTMGRLAARGLAKRWFDPTGWVTLSMWQLTDSPLRKET